MSNFTSFNINGIDASINALGVAYDDSSTLFGVNDIQTAIEEIDNNLDNVIDITAKQDIILDGFIQDYPYQVLINEKSYTVRLTTTDLSYECAIGKYQVYIRSDETFHFALYDMTDTPVLLVEYPDGTDYSAGITIDLSLDKAIKLAMRTWLSGVVVDYKLSKFSSTVINDMKNALGLVYHGDLKYIGNGIQYHYIHFLNLYEPVGDYTGVTMTYKSATFSDGYYQGLYLRTYDENKQRLNNIAISAGDSLTWTFLSTEKYFEIFYAATTDVRDVKNQIYEVYGVSIQLLPTIYQPTLDEIITGYNLHSQFTDTVLLGYGDSITAQCNGDYVGEFNTTWLPIIANNVNASAIYCRGVGGQTYKWNDNGYYCKADSTGGYINRYKAVDSSINTSNGQVTVSATADDISAIESVLGYSIEIHRGCFCSWDRITSMADDSFKDNVDYVFIMGGINDFSNIVDTSIAYIKPLWNADNTTDSDWVSSEYYNGGDYDVTTIWGAFASTFMKMQTWMPNAKIICLIPITITGTNYNNPTNSSGATEYDLITQMKSVCDWCNIEYIDLNCCGITQFNVDTMLSDGVHPSTAGQNLMAEYITKKLIAVS